MDTAKKILVVSKDSHFIHNLNSNLTQKNLEISSTKARDEELLKIISETTPDLTVLDLPLTSMDSIRQLVGIRDSLDTPILMLSTEGAKADTVRTLTLGSSNHAFIKPITFEQLTEQIHKLLEPETSDK